MVRDLNFFSIFSLFKSSSLMTNNNLVPFTFNFMKSEISEIVVLLTSLLLIGEYVLPYLEKSSFK